MRTPRIYCAKRGLLAVTLALVLVLLAVGESAARRRGLLMLNSPRQWLSVGYRWDGQRYDASGGRSSRSQQSRLEESYHLGFRYALWHPRLLNGSADLDLGLEHEWIGNDAGSDRASGGSLSYLVSGTLLERRALPLSFHARQGREVVSRNFSGSYDVDSRGYGFSLPLHNRYLPAFVGYRNYESQTRGLSRDRRQLSEDVQITADNRIGNWSLTSLSARAAREQTRVDGGGGSSRHRSRSANLQNRLLWGRVGRPGRLSSNYRYRRDRGDLNSLNRDWSESLDWQLGRVLRVGGDYRRSSWESPEQRRREAAARLWGQHRLFDSLFTRVDLDRRNLDTRQGDETETAGHIGWNYSKQLTGKNRLLASYSYGRGITERNLDSDTLPVRDERVQIDLFTRNVLGHPEVELSTVRVYPQDRAFPYSANTDYVLRTHGEITEITIPPGSAIDDGEVLSVDYAYRVEPAVTYATTRHRASASVSAFEGRYSLRASYRSSEQDRLHSRDSQVHLSQSRLLSLAVERKGRPVEWQLTYSNLDSSGESYAALEGVWRYRRVLRRQEWTLQLRDRLTWFAASDNGDSGGRENTVDALLSQQQRWSSNVLGRFTFFYRGDRGRGGRQDNSGGRFRLDARVGKVELSLWTEVEWQFRESSRQREEQLQLQLRRRF